ncbi:MAG: hypothetical protein IH946_07950, partial [Bacteroidetes bacterium]|nr:hypothetical protein [Bacteroidota bacterium]
MSIDRAKKLLGDYLTFYHEIRIPANPFFSGKENDDDVSRPLIISSPSRMGNHVLQSLLDSHPDVPRVPGEDSFLSMSFRKSNHDLNEVLASFKGTEASGFCMSLSGGSINHHTHENKWEAYRKAYEAQQMPDKYTGIESSEKLVILDYQDTLLEINYESYKDHLIERAESIRAAKSYKDVLLIYLEACNRLDPKPLNTAFAGIMVNSGLRAQCKWLCEHFKQ